MCIHFTVHYICTFEADILHSNLDEMGQSCAKVILLDISRHVLRLNHQQRFTRYALIRLVTKHYMYKLTLTAPFRLLSEVSIASWSPTWAPLSMQTQTATAAEIQVFTVFVKDCKQNRDPIPVQETRCHFPSCLTLIDSHVHKQ